jgi:hypothetical protein
LRHGCPFILFLVLTSSYQFYYATEGNIRIQSQPDIWWRYVQLCRG